MGREELGSGTGSRECRKAERLRSLAAGWGWAAAANPKPLHLLFCLTESSQASLAALAVECELPGSLRGPLAWFRTTSSAASFW